VSYYFVVVRQPNDSLSGFASLVGIIAGLVTIAQAFDQPKRTRRRRY
jgi:hypothetical protein